MRIGHVIGKTVMSQQDAAFKGARWLLINPIDGDQMNDACDKPPQLSQHFTVVIYDRLGAGQGDIVGFVEGPEATAPFEDPMPIDGITVAIFDTIHYVPYEA